MDIYRKEGEQIVFGKSILAIICNGGLHAVENLGIYQDGMIDCWGLITFDEFQEKIKSGWIKTSVVAEKDIYILPLGKVRGGIFYPGVKEVELIKEVKDVIEELNGRPTTSEICIEVFAVYMKDESVENKEKLKTAYENIPEHQRKDVLGDDDLDDMPIRIVLYGEESIENKVKLDIFRGKIADYFKANTR